MPRTLVEGLRESLGQAGSLAFALALGTLAALWVAAYLRDRKGAPAGRGLVILAAILPPLAFALVSLAAAPRFGDLRVALEGLRFRFGDGGGPAEIRVGGSPENDHLVVPDLPEGFLTFRKTGGGVKIEIHPDSSPQTDESDADDARRGFAVVRVDGHRPFHNAVELDGPVSIVVGGQKTQLDPASLPVRTTPLGPFRPRILRQLPAEQEIFPVRDFAAPARGVPLLGPHGEPLGSFVARDIGLLRRTPFLVIADEAVQVELKSGRAGFQREVKVLGDGDSVKLALFRVDLEPPGSGQRPSRAQERRSFTASYKGGTLDLILDTPAYVRIRPAELEKLRRSAERADTQPLIRILGRRFESTAAEGQMLLEYSSLGDPLSTELFSRIELPEGNDLRITTHTGARIFHLGEAFEVGQASAAIVRISRLGLPWGTLLLLAAGAAAAVAAGLGRRQHLLSFVFLSGVEMLLALRLLIAYEGAYLDPASASAAWQTLAACLAVPFALQATLELYERRALGLLSWLHGVVVAAGMITALLAARAEGMEILLAVALPLAVLPAIAGLFGLPLLDRLPWSDPPQSQPRPFLLPWIFAGILLAVRVITLFALGWKERMDLLVAVLAVSLYAVPFALFIFALLWGRRERPRAWLHLWLLLAGVYGLLSWAARDLGALLIFPLPVLLLFALPLIEGKRPLASTLLAFPLITVLIAHAVVLPFFPLFRPGWTPSDAEKARVDPAAAQSLLASRTAADRNRLRLWNQFAPDRLREVGTNEAEGLVIVMENLRAYGSRGTLGEGWLGVPLSEPLRATHLDDNLSAVHLLGPFGWAGTLALLALLAGWVVLPLTAVPSAKGNLDPKTAFGLLTAWTLGLSGLYMISANVGLLLFTGKNVYFLAAASLSDMAEGSLLVLLALWALDSRPAASAVSAARGTV
jgi:hypothetical protein